MTFVRTLVALSIVAPLTLAAQSPSLVAGLRADLTQFRSAFMGFDRSFADSARKRAESQLRVLEGALDTIGAARFELELARIAALADNGHSGAIASVRARRYNRVPIRVLPFGDAFHVVRATRVNADLLGARLVAIDGRAITDARTVAHSLTGGTAKRRDLAAPFFFESPQQLHAFGLARATTGATYAFEMPGGQRVERRLDAMPAGAGATVETGRLFYPQPVAGEDETWSTLLSPTNAPWSLQDFDARFRLRRAPELDAVIVELRQNFSSRDTDIGTFLRGVEAELRRDQPKNLVLDMRMNGGGNLQLTRDFMRNLPSLIPGRIFVLTSPWTFSAAISSVGYLEQAAPDRVTIVGEIVGDRLDFWAEGGPVTLTNTGIMFGRSTERHDYANGCRAYSDCHRPVVNYPIAVRTLAPDIVAPWTVDSYRTGRDPAMDAVARALKPAS